MCSEATSVFCWRAAPRRFLPLAEALLIGACAGIPDIGTQVANNALRHMCSLTGVPGSLHKRLLHRRFSVVARRGLVASHPLRQSFLPKI
jgi:hypothetical protein